MKIAIFIIAILLCLMLGMVGSVMASDNWVSWIQQIKINSENIIIAKTDWSLEEAFPGHDECVNHTRAAFHDLYNAINKTGSGCSISNISSGTVLTCGGTLGKTQYFLECFPEAIDPRK
jgi:hypothetical protein